MFPRHVAWQQNEEPTPPVLTTTDPPVLTTPVAQVQIVDPDEYEGAAIPPAGNGPRYASGRNQNPPSGNPFDVYVENWKQNTAKFGRLPWFGGDYNTWMRGGYQRRTSGGGGQGIQFDQAAITENTRSKWRYLMLEEPANLNGLVAEYMAESRSMGMALNLDAWLIQRARRDARYQLLYGRKPAELSEEEYIGSLRGVTEQLGLSSRGTRQQIEAAAGSGQTAAGFARRAGETREARSSNLGLFSRKVAQAFNSLGSLGRGA